VSWYSHDSSIRLVEPPKVAATPIVLFAVLLCEVGNNSAAKVLRMALAAVCAKSPIIQAVTINPPEL